MSHNPADICLPSVCMWEAIALAQRGRIDLRGAEPASFLRQLVQRSGFAEAPLTSEIASLSRTLPFGHEDSADRFIAATAYALNAELATSDPRLRNLKWIKLAF